MATDPMKKKDAEQDVEETYKAAEAKLGESNTEAVNAINNSYGAQETAMSKILEEAETLRAEKQQLDEEAQKRADAYRYISGIGDAISGVANLVGTTQGAANQTQHYNAPEVIQKAEASRKERKLEMDQLNERIRELKAQKGALASTRELKLGEQRAKHAAELASLELQKGKDTRAAEEAARAESWRQKNFDEEVRQYNEGQEFRQGQWNDQKDQWQKTYDLKLQEFEKAQEANMYNITLSGESFDIPKTKLNPGNVERIWKLLPQEVRDGVKGKTVTTYEADEYGQSQRKTSNEAPTTDQKLAAVVAYADYDRNVAAELKRLAEESADSADKPKSNPADDPNL